MRVLNIPRQRVPGLLIFMCVVKVVSADSMGNVHVWLVETGLLAFRYCSTHVCVPCFRAFVSHHVAW